MQLVEKEIKEKVKEFLDSIGIRYEEENFKLKIKGIIESVDLDIIPHISVRIDVFRRIIIEKYLEKTRIMYEPQTPNEHIRDLLINNEKAPKIEYRYGELILNF